jgi:glycosyltransferase involved in cell wall biosynthesis
VRRIAELTTMAIETTNLATLTELTAQDCRDVEFTIVMPCLNEAETLATCIEKARRSFRENNISGEIIVADNGSTDGSQAIAVRHGARVVSVAAKGYGNALMGGIAAARGKYVIMGDADDSYDFSSLGPFIEKLRAGYDLVMGNRFGGGILPGAMPPLHRYLGNPLLTFIGRLFFRSPVGDFHCGLRGFSKEAVTKLDLRTTGMEFASEMVVKATLQGMRIVEVPTTLSPDGRSRAPHLRSWRDGWRHLRFLLLYSPRWLFLYPGALLMLFGLLGALWLLPGPRIIEGVKLDVHTLLYAAAAMIIGFQAIIFAVFTKIFAISEGLLPDDPRLERMFRYVTLEVGLAVGLILILAGAGGSIYAYWTWNRLSFGELNPSRTMRIVIPAVTSLTLGFQTLLSSFFLSILGLRRR